MATYRTRIIFNNESDSIADYKLAAEEIDNLLCKFNNSEYLNTAVVHQEFHGREVTGEVRLDFKPNTYASTRIKVAKQIDKGIQDILNKYSTITDLVHYFILIFKLDEQFYRRYRYLAIKNSKFYLLSMTTESKVLPIETSSAEKMILDELEKGGDNDE